MNEVLVEITRHIAGPPRRSPGQRFHATGQTLREQGLAEGDYRIISDVDRKTITDRQIKAPRSRR